MNCLIIDDEPLARAGIRLLIEQVDFLQLVGEYSNPLKAHDLISRSENIDLIFLDIEMPGINGLDYLKSLSPKSFVILTTAYPQYALEAFELDVLDYLVKPVKLERFLKAVSKARDLSQLSKSDLEIKKGDPFVYIKSERQYVKIYLDEIRFIKGLKDYVIIQTKDQKYLTAMNVGTIGRQLPESHFARVSKSYIINVHFIHSVDHDVINLENVEIPLGRTYKDDFIRNYISGRLLKR